MSNETAPDDGAPAGSGGVLWFIAAILGAMVCFVAAAAFGSAIGRPHKAPTALLAAVTIGFGIAAVALVRAAIHLEHRWNAGSQHAPHPTAPASNPARQPKNGPWSRIVSLVALLALAGIIVAVATNLHSQAVRSSETQHGGLARSGTVTSAQSQRHYTRYSTWTTYIYGVSLAAPAGAATATVAHDPTKDFQDFLVGDPIHVVVDPHQSDYAELPGRPMEPSTYYVGPLILLVAFLVLAVALTAEEVKLRRAKHTQPA